MFRIFTSEFSTVGIHRQMQPCAHECLAMVTEGVVHSICKVVTKLCFSVIWQH